MARMNLLLWIMLSEQNFDYDSNYTMLRNYVDGSDKDKVVFVVALPKDVRLNDNFLFERENVLPIGIPFPSGKREQNVWFDSNLVKKVINKYFVSLLYTNVPETVTMMKVLEQSFTHNGVVVATMNHWVIHPTLAFYESYRGLRDLQMIGMRNADIVLYNSRYAKWMFEDEMKRFGWGEEIRREIEEKSTVVGLPIITDTMRKIEVKDVDENVFIYNHRTEFYKRTEITFDVFDRLQKEGYKFKVKLSLTGAGKNIKYASKEYVVPFFKPNKIDYLNEIAIKHINTFNSAHETFCISMVESAYLGGIPVVPAGLTFEELFGEDYPFIFKSVNEQIQMLRDILGKKIEDEVEYWRKELRKRVEEKYSAERFAHTVFEILDKKMKEVKAFVWQRMSDDMRKHILNKLKKENGNVYEASQIADLIRDKKYGIQVFTVPMLGTVLYGHIDWFVEDGKLYGELREDEI